MNCNEGTFSRTRNSVIAVFSVCAPLAAIEFCLLWRAWSVLLHHLVARIQELKVIIVLWSCVMQQNFVLRIHGPELPLSGLKKIFSLPRPSLQESQRCYWVVKGLRMKAFGMLWSVVVCGQSPVWQETVVVWHTHSIAQHTTCWLLNYSFSNQTQPFKYTPHHTLDTW